MDAVGFGGALEGAEDVVSYAPGFEGPAGLEVLEFEEDSASAV